MHNEPPLSQGARRGAESPARAGAVSSRPLVSPATPAAPARRPRGWRVAGGVALAAVLGLAFWGYTTPGMQIHWENLAALCGF